MSFLLFAALVTILPWYEDQAAQAAPSRVKVFLASSPDVRVQRDCFALLATSLTAQIAETRTVVPARSAADADVIVRVKECRTVDAPQAGGEVHIATTVGGGSKNSQAGGSLAAEVVTVARVVLVVDDRGKPVEFAPTLKDLPLPAAAHDATASFLAWVKTAHTN
jgi:hypothetical protein